MSGIHDVGERLFNAKHLSAILDAAYDAFQEMLVVIRAHEDPADNMFTALVMAAGSAADGRDAILLSPSLPPNRLHPAAAREHNRTESAAGTVDALAELSGLLVTRLGDAARLAANPADRGACMYAGRWAQDAHTFLTRGGP